MRSDFTLYANDLEVTNVRKLICDRCGKEIDQGYNDDYNLHPKAFCRIFGDKNSGIYSKTEDLEYDLCENCANELVEFLKG